MLLPTRPKFPSFGSFPVVFSVLPLGRPLYKGLQRSVVVVAFAPSNLLPVLSVHIDQKNFLRGLGGVLAGFLASFDYHWMGRRDKAHVKGRHVGLGGAGAEVDPCAGE